MKKSKLLNMTVMQAAAEFMVAAILLSLLCSMRRSKKHCSNT